MREARLASFGHLVDEADECDASSAAVVRSRILLPGLLIQQPGRNLSPSVSIVSAPTPGASSFRAGITSLEAKPVLRFRPSASLQRIQTFVSQTAGSSHFDRPVLPPQAESPIPPSAECARE